jgi:hypothetical protein
MTSQAIVQKRFRFTLRSLFATVTALSILFGMVTAVCRWQAVKSQERQAQADLYPYGGVYSTASALYNIRTGGQSKGWLFVTFLNYVEAVDLSPHNWSAMERRGKTIAVDDDALAMLCRFRELRSLDLRDTPVTDGGVRHIAVLRRLEQLDLRGTRITDDGLQTLREALPNCAITGPRSRAPGQ